MRRQSDGWPQRSSQIIKMNSRSQTCKICDQRILTKTSRRSSSMLQFPPWYQSDKKVFAIFEVQIWWMSSRWYTLQNINTQSRAATRSASLQHFLQPTWFSPSSHIRFYFDIVVGNARADVEHDRSHVSEVASKVSELNGKLKEVRREQQYYVPNNIVCWVLQLYCTKTLSTTVEPCGWTQVRQRRQRLQGSNTGTIATTWMPIEDGRHTVWLGATASELLSWCVRIRYS
jgi:hypothetical protein